MKERARKIDVAKLQKFGRNLCAERNRAGLSQEGLGNLINKDGAYIGMIERGAVNTTLSTVIQLIEALNISFDSLYKPE